jgi:hypothetical protein
MLKMKYLLQSIFWISLVGLPFLTHGQLVPYPGLIEIPNPCREGGESNLFVDDRGVAWLSWVEFVDDSTDVLYCTWLEQGAWAPAREVARGNNWFVNWADFPSLAVFPGTGGQSIAAHWLQKSAKGTFDYDVRVSLSQNRGATWTPSFVLHQDGIAAEHGFVTLAPVAPGRIRAVWLDGRHTKMEGDMAEETGHEGHHGAMSLHSAVFDPSGTILRDEELDPKVCDCCQTDAAIGPEGAVVVYRDRSDEEIRDIYVIREENGGWTTPYPLHRDEWMIAGCPVNGPAISLWEKQAVVVWFSAAKGKPRVQACFSRDHGKTFGRPIRVHDEIPIGRVDVEWLDAKTAAVTWMEQRGDQAIIRTRKIGIGGKARPAIDLLPSSAARASGFPILVKDAEGLLLSTTEVGADAHTRVRTFRLKL